LYFVIAHQISVTLDKLLFLLAQAALLAVCITLFSTFPHNITKSHHLQSKLYRTKAHPF